MKKIILTAIIAVTAFVSCNNKGSNSGHESVKLVSSLDSVSYAIGSNIGTSMKVDFSEANITALTAGIHDALNDNDLAIDQDKLEPIIQEYIMKKQDEERAKSMKNENQ